MTAVNPVTEISSVSTEEKKENFTGISSTTYRRAFGDE
jgi:hypothetical protein